MENKALAIISKASQTGALVFAAQNLETPPLYKAEATLIHVELRDFHDVQGKLVARKETTDKIGDAAGVDFISDRCGVKTELRDDDFGRRTVFIGYAQGRVRLSDGSWRNSSVEEYEFDPKVRALSENGGDKKVLEYTKVARQRASTGARLRVIRQLTGMPTAFDKGQIGNGKELAFSRIVQNTDYILGTKEGRMMAIAAATGMAQSLYGPRPDTTPEPGPSSSDSFDDEPPMRDANEPRESPANLAAQALDDDPFALEPEPAPQSNSEVNGLINTLVDYLNSGALPPKGCEFIQAALDRKERDVVVLRDLADRSRKAYDAVLAARKQKAAS